MGQLLNVTFSFLSHRCIRWPGFVPIGVSCRYVIDVLLLGIVCCIRLIRTLIIVCSASFHLLLLEFDLRDLRYRTSIRVWSIKAKKVSIARSLLPAQVWMRNYFPFTVLDTGTLDGFKGAVNSWLLPWVVFFSVFHGAGACGVAKLVFKQLCFSRLVPCCWF